jgi:hypothetical protein
MIARARFTAGAAVVLPFISVFGVQVALAASKIGVASAVSNHVESISGGSSRSLGNGGEIFAEERVRTGEGSSAQLLFLDQTTLNMGARSEVVLDRFVYDPNRGSGAVTIRTGLGAFRFVTGTQAPQNYQIKTQAATMGIRGTVINWIEKRSGGKLEGIYSVSHGRIQITLGGNTYTVTAGQMIAYDSTRGTNGPVQNNNGQGDPRPLDAFNNNTDLANLLGSFSQPGNQGGGPGGEGGGPGGGGGPGSGPPPGGFTPPGQFQAGGGTPLVGPGIGNIPPGLVGNTLPPGIGGSNPGKKKGGN